MWPIFTLVAKIFINVNKLSPLWVGKLLIPKTAKNKRDRSTNLGGYCMYNEMMYCRYCIYWSLSTLKVWMKHVNFKLRHGKRRIPYMPYACFTSALNTRVTLLIVPARYSKFLFVFHPGSLCAICATFSRCMRNGVTWPIPLITCSLLGIRCFFYFLKV